MEFENGNLYTFINYKKNNNLTIWFYVNERFYLSRGIVKREYMTLEELKVHKEKELEATWTYRRSTPLDLTVMGVI